MDYSRRVGVLFVAVLHFVTDHEDPYGSVTAFRERMPSGSFVVISHITSDDTAPETIRFIKEAYKEASAPAVSGAAKR